MLAIVCWPSGPPHAYITLIIGNPPAQSLSPAAKQQHSDSSIGGSHHECDSALFGHAFWKDDGELGSYQSSVRLVQINALLFTNIASTPECRLYGPRPVTLLKMIVWSQSDGMCLAKASSE